MPFPRDKHNATSIAQILIFYCALDSSRRDKSFAARITQKRPNRRAGDRLFNIFRTPLAKKSSLFAAVPERVEEMAPKAAPELDASFRSAYEYLFASIKADARTSTDSRIVLYIPVHPHRYTYSHIPSDPKPQMTL